jgi:hypothetical protein
MRVKRNNKSYRTRCIFYWVVAVILASLSLAIAGEIDAILAWWFAIVLLLPPFLWAIKTPYVALKTICGVSFLTQIVTMPFFYLYRDNFAWGHVKPFHFTAWESIPMLAKVSLFLFSLVLSFKLLYPISLFGGGGKFKSSIPLRVATQDRLNIYSGYNLIQNKKTWLFSILIILLIAVLIPLNLWSYSQGIGLTGIEPPALPYRLSGILFYLTKYITPALIGYFYFKTKRSWLLMLIILTYAWVLGLSSISKGAVLFVMFPVLTLAWLDKRKIMFGIAFIGTMIGISVASGARSYVYVVTAGKVGADSSFSIFQLIFNLFTDPDGAMWEIDFLPKIINGVLARIEGFENLVMAQYYDPNATIGALGFILRMAGLGGAYFDIDAHMIQWQGNVLPEGFFNGGALLSNAVILGNDGPWWIVLSAIVTSLFLVILEKNSHRMASKYVQFELLNVPTIFALTMIFFSTTGASAVAFTYPFVLLLFASWLPTISRKNKWRQSKLESPIAH